MTQPPCSSQFLGNTLWFNSCSKHYMTGTMYIKTVSVKNGIASKPSPKTVRTHKSSNLMVAGPFEGSTYIAYLNGNTYRVDVKTGAKTRLETV